jgi:hypothetical protein
MEPNPIGLMPSKEEETPGEGTHREEVTGRHPEKAAICKPRREDAETLINPVCTLILDFWTPEL